MSLRSPPQKLKSEATKHRVSSFSGNSDSIPKEKLLLSTTVPKPGVVSSLTQAFEANLIQSSNQFPPVSGSSSRSNYSTIRPRNPTISAFGRNPPSTRRGSVQGIFTVDETSPSYNEFKAKFQQIPTNMKTSQTSQTLSRSRKLPFHQFNHTVELKTSPTHSDTVRTETSLLGKLTSNTDKAQGLLVIDEETITSSDDSIADTNTTTLPTTSKKIVADISKHPTPFLTVSKRKPPAPPPLRRWTSNGTKKLPTNSNINSGTTSNNYSSISHAQSEYARSNLSSPFSSTRISRPRGYAYTSVRKIQPEKNVSTNLDKIFSNTTSVSDSKPGTFNSTDSTLPQLSPPSLDQPKNYSSESLPADSIADSVASDQECKRLEKKSKVIEELVETEASYLKDLHILDKIYYQRAQKSEIFQSRDIATLFCNLPEMIDFTEKFCELLRVLSSEVTLEAEKSSKWVGEAFSLMMPKLETVYCNYCKAHESAVIRLNELQSSRIATDFFESCKEEIKGQTTSWDFGSLLIKPVQRVLKYPLLLQQILLLTPESDSDFDCLRSVNQDIQKVAERINEIKKRKDIVETIVGIKKKEAVFSHGINKIITRRTQQIKQAAGLQDATTDILFDHFLAKFEHQQCGAKNLVANAEHWRCRVLEYLDKQMKFAEMMERMYAGANLGDRCKRGLEIQAKEYLISMAKIYMRAQRKIDFSIKSLIIPQIEAFLNLFQKPQSVIRKREHKLLDYDRARSIKLRGDKPDTALEKSVNDYIAINAQLQDELPKFFGLTTQYYNVMVKVIANIQSRFYQELALELEHVYQLLVPHDTHNYNLENIVQEYCQSLECEGGFHHQLDEIQLLRKEDNLPPGLYSDGNSSVRAPFGRTLSLKSPYPSETDVSSKFYSLKRLSKPRKAKLNINRTRWLTARSVSNGNQSLGLGPFSRQLSDEQVIPEEVVPSSRNSSLVVDSIGDITALVISPRRSDLVSFRCTVIHPFQAEYPDEIDLALDSVLQVSKTEESEELRTMWYGEDAENGQIGWFPASHCVLLQ